MILKTLYGLPKKVLFCKKSLISNQTPNSTQEFKHTLKSKKKTTFIVKMEIQILGNILIKRKLIGKKRGNYKTS